MSDEPQTEPSGGGVFGNLPDSRPGTRSPRRDPSGGGARTPVETERRGASAARERGPAAETAPEPAQPQPHERPAPSDAEPEPEKHGGGLEDIAWAGVAAAAEAATIGVRLASRAIEALRGNAEKE
jgi:hypothetical protein